MRNKEVIFWTTVIALIGGGVLFVSLNKNQITIDVKNNNTTATQAPVKTNVSNNTNIKIVPKVTIPTVSKPVSATSYAQSELSKHNNQTSCWTAINGKIYDITSFISSHPAGVQKILQGCGIDATNLYGRVGAHDISKLSTFVVGILK